jgi:hypothetical protein
MADSGIKKFKISNALLPPISVEEEAYVVRYRIVSEDKNRTSHWSPITIVDPDYTFTTGAIHHTKSGDVNSIAWDPVIISKDGNEIRKAHEFDVWVRWDRNDNGDWAYLQRIDTPSISILTPTTYNLSGVVQVSPPNRLSVEVFLKGTPITRDSVFLRMYEGGRWTV